ncbi:TPA: aldose epimerase family protein [Vibrio parahaemolyticus]|uniref:aldose epimerase family protein n=1 Tax=Vibrio harveyi group TaxID=717610 RepID=UPI001B841509|nr:MULTISPECIES: aldose epimerase family protein [Vibrio harveyi group]MCR9881972.1 galactose mutarotase [Vibrio parahaemolyticus]MCR9896644.1 galactose mutarotase [Vibrio parahaemolyticus]MCZ6400038.1 galactose mutarotase [Vibrio alginolyticus]HBC3402632.1 galactose mutarotase [Vibrio parahaemolyticus]
MKTQEWGDFSLYTLENDLGSKIVVSDLGATIVDWWVKDKSGTLTNIVLGFEKPEQYLETSAYIGSVVGPWANRIYQGKYQVNGVDYELDLNEGVNHLHGGSVQLDKRLWSVKSYATNGILFTTKVAQGEAGYPANLDIDVRYTLTEDNKLEVEYTASADNLVPINLTQHTYFNLSGGSENIVNQEARIDADDFLSIDGHSIPFETTSVMNTAMDLRKFCRLKDRLAADDQQVKLVNGFDHCWCLNAKGMALAAQVYNPSNGIYLDVYTDQDGVQLYTGNSLPAEMSRTGQPFSPYDGLCLETQHYPNQVNMPQYAEECIYGPDKRYTHKTVFEFGSR